MENIDMSSVQLITDSYQNYHRSVYLYILYKIGKDEDAKDLAQDVFLRLMDYKQMLRPETIKYFIFSIWLLIICVVIIKCRKLHPIF